MRALRLRLLLLALSGLLSLALVEVLLRVLDLAPSQGIGSVTEADFSRYPGLLTPGQELVDREKPALPYHVRINSLGYRGADFNAEKRRDELRVLAIGDSFTYGDFVDDSETLPARLERELRRNCGDVTVVNAGIGGTTLVTHAEMARRALPLSPDVIMLTFSENDVVDLAAPMWHSLAANRRAKSRFPLSIVYPVLRQTALWNFGLKVRGTVATWGRPQVVADAREDEAAAEAAREAERVRMATLRDGYASRLAALRDWAAAADLPLVLALYPSHHSVLDPAATEQLDWLEATAGGLGIPTVSLLEPLRQSGEAIDALYLLPEDGHPSPLGYAIGARALAADLDWAALSGGRCAPAQAESAARSGFPVGSAGRPVASTQEERVSTFRRHRNAPTATNG